MTELKRILLVEDDPNDVELTLTALSDHQLANDVQVVSDGVEALDYLFRREAYANRPEGRPIVVLLDIKLPKINGIEVLRQIRQDRTLCLLPVVMLTSSREERDLIATYQNGVNGYVVKPLDFHSFIEAVKGLSVFWALINQPPPLLPANFIPSVTQELKNGR